jgi:hypothetical protein
VILPGRNARRTGHYSESPHVNVIVNDAKVQAVTETTLGITAGNFRTDSTQTAGIITVNRKASVLVCNDGNFIDVSVSDPTQSNLGDIGIQLAASASAVISADQGVRVTQTSPGIAMTVNVNGAKGRSFRARFHTGTPQVLNLTPVADTYAHDSNLNADSNFGTSTGLAVKKGPVGFNREAFLRFDVPLWKGLLIDAELKLMPLSAAVPGIHGVSGIAGDSWIEAGSGGLTWNNKPASAGLPVSTWSPVTGVQSRADVRSLIEGSGPVSFHVIGITETSNGIVNLGVA